jgi:cytochrome c oxidase cbb3-type subunit IV
MSYEQISQFAQTWGLVLLAVCFIIAVVYALWPGNKEKFKRAARTPLENGDNNGAE